MGLFKMERMNHTALLFLFLIGFYGTAQAPLVLRFAEHLQQIDPNVVGKYTQSQVGLYFTGQWLGIDAAPNEKGFFFNGFFPLKKLKWGGTLRQRNRFAENNTALLLQFSYPLAISTNTQILLGIQGETDFYRLDFSKLRSVDGVSNDPLLGREAYHQPNVGVGLNLLHKTWHFRFALPQLLNQKNSSYLSDIRLAKNQSYFIDISNTVYSYNQKSMTISLQWHNLIWSNPTYQLQFNYAWRNLKGTFALNHRKMVGVGFRFVENRAWTFCYGYQWQFAFHNNLNLNQHLFSMRFRFGTLATSQ